MSAVSLTAQTGDYRTLQADEFFAKLDESRKEGNAVLLDVRTPAEYRDGNSPLAENLDFYAPDFRSILGKLDKDNAYFLYCRSGSRSGQTLRMMKDLGFREVYDLAGGWSANARRLAAVR